MSGNQLSALQMLLIEGISSVGICRKWRGWQCTQAPLCKRVEGLTLYGKHESDCSLALRQHDHFKQTSQSNVNWVVSCRSENGHALVQRG
jgi:hypothetical protein